MESHLAQVHHAQLEDLPRRPVLLQDGLPRVVVMQAAGRPGPHPGSAAGLGLTAWTNAIPPGLSLVVSGSLVMHFSLLGGSFNPPPTFSRYFEGNRFLDPSQKRSSPWGFPGLQMCGALRGMGPVAVAALVNSHAGSRAPPTPQRETRTAQKWFGCARDWTAGDWDRDWEEGTVGSELFQRCRCAFQMTKVCWPVEIMRIAKQIPPTRQLRVAPGRGRRCTGTPAAPP